MIKTWTDAAWEDFEYWMRQDRKTLRRIQLLRDIDRNGYEGIGKPERLSGNKTKHRKKPVFMRVCGVRRSLLITI